MKKLGLLLLLCGIAVGLSAETKPLEISPKKSTGSLKATLSSVVAKVKAGTNEFKLTLLDDKGKAYDLKTAAIFVEANMPSMMHGSAKGDATYVGPGVWTFKAKFSMSGEWAIKIIVKEGDKEIASFNFVLPVN